MAELTDKEIDHVADRVIEKIRSQLQRCERIQRKNSIMVRIKSRLLAIRNFLSNGS
jgi:hypothetical protein